MLKKGYITTWVAIFGTFIVLIGIFMFFLSAKTDLVWFSDEIFEKGNGNNNAINKITPEIQESYNLIHNCIEENTIDALQIIGLSGGHLVLNESFIETDQGKTGYGSINNENILPTIDEIESNIENHVKALLFNCNEKTNYQGLSIDEKNSEVFIYILNEHVTFEAIVPISITDGFKLSKYNSPYEINIPVNFNKIHETANLIINNQISDPNFIDLSFTGNEEIVNSDFRILIDPKVELDVIYRVIDKDNILIIITDSNSKLDGISYSFQFGINLNN